MNKDEMTQEQLKEEHKSIGNVMNANAKHIDQLRKVAEASSIESVRQNAVDQMKVYEKRMEDQRAMQKEIYEKYKENQEAEYYEDDEYEDATGETTEPFS
jgi:hypothetical protein